MVDLEASKHAQSQHATGLFRRFRIGDGLNGMNLKHDLNIVYNFIESLRGENGITVFKNGDGSGAVIDTVSGAKAKTKEPDPDEPYEPTGPPADTPTGYSERANSIIDIRWDATAEQIQIKTGTILVKDDTESDWFVGIPLEAFDD